MICDKCGKELFDEAVICPNCGCPTKNYYQQQPQANMATPKNPQSQAANPPQVPNTTPQGQIVKPPQPQQVPQFTQPICNRLTPNQKRYFSKVNDVYGLAITSTCLCLGIGIVFAIISIVLKSKLPAFESSDDEYFLELYNKAQRKLSVSNKLIAATIIIFAILMSIPIIVEFLYMS